MKETKQTKQTAKKTTEQTAEKEPFDWKKEAVEWLKILVTAAVIAFCINTFLVANSVVPSGSMEETIMTGDRILGSRLAYRFGKEPERGDIVIFYHETGPANVRTRLVKRIIGLPGETVDIKDNQVYINQSETPLDEPYLKEAMDSDDYHFEIPEDCYLMLGDNRNGSADARSWNDPYVPEKEILAKVMFRYYPGIKKLN